MLKMFLSATILCAIPALAQPQFEVASIKPAARPTPAMGAGHYRYDNAAFENDTASLLELITTAYRISWNRVTGPSWLNDQYFSVAAKLPTGSTKEQIPAMLQKLLADRFKLAVHHDSKVESVYLLTTGKDGVKLKPTPDDADLAFSGCNSRPGQFNCRAMTLPQVANHWSGLAAVQANMPRMAADDGERTIDRPVVDQTGLPGKYEIDLQWVPPGGFPSPGGRRGNAFPPRDPSVKATNIFEAAEAAGLKLQPGKHTFDNLVVDRVERVPTVN